MFAPQNSQTQQAICYDEKELTRALADLGLTPTPLPSMPVSIQLPDGRTLDARKEFIGGAMDEPGSDRYVLFVHP